MRSSVDPQMRTSGGEETEECMESLSFSEICSPSSYPLDSWSL